MEFEAVYYGDEAIERVRSKMKQAEADIQAVGRVEVLADAAGICVSNLPCLHTELNVRYRNLKSELKSLSKPTTEEVIKALSVLEAHFLE